MSDQETQRQTYAVSVQEQPQETHLFSFVPLADERDGAPRRKQFVVTVRIGADGMETDWSESPDDPGNAKEEIESEINARLEEKVVWMDRIRSLVDQMESWIKELGWSTRRIEKTLEDARFGKHRVPALLMQEDTCRILLEPLGRSAPGTEGVVDLYLMPAYDDIANLYYYEGDWRLHYAFAGDSVIASIGEGSAVRLSKDVVAKVLAEMRQHAA